MKQLLLSSIFSLASLFALGQANNYPNGSTVANFTVTDTEGNVHSLHSYTAQGKYVILDFFFDTCPPCQATSPYFSELHQTYGCNEEDLVCLAINNGTDSDAEVIAYENTYGGSFAHPPAASTEGGSAAVDAAFGVSAYPTYCLISPTNIMVNYDIWPVSNMGTFVAAFPPGSGITPAACAVGVPEQHDAGITAIFPSPTSGLVTVSTESTKAVAAVLEVFDMLGQRVHVMDLGMLSGASTHTVDLGHLTNGNYTLQLSASGTTTSRHRLVVAH